MKQEMKLALRKEIVLTFNISINYEKFVVFVP